MIAKNTVGPSLFREIKQLIALLIRGERNYIWVAVIYGLAISLLTLAVPISVQMLINSVAHTASLRPVLVLAFILLFLLMVSGGMTALQYYVMELFERRFYARITAQFALRCIYADHLHFEGINRSELVNRYFDIMNVQRIVPSLVIGFFSLLLQMGVGVVLVSFYHPWLLVFNLCFVGLLVTIWRIWAYRAIRSSINMSDAKYRTARHLEDVAMANTFFKAERNIKHAIKKTDELTRNYLKARIGFFRNSFSQTIALLVLYAVASAGLLGIGGTLVVRGQLTLGQLVASELILSVVFFGIVRLAYYWKQFYEISASLEEISQLYAVPLEDVQGTQTLPDEPAPVQFKNAVYLSQHGTPEVTLNFGVAPRTATLIGVASQHIQTAMLHSFKQYRAPLQGQVLLGEYDLRDYDKHLLRSEVIILDLPTVVEATIEEYLRIAAPDASIKMMHEVLEKVELKESIYALDDGMDTLLTVSGSPLTPSETLRLKLAAAWLAQPQLLILGELFDAISYERRQRIFSHLCAEKPMTLLYFSNRKDLEMFDHYMFVDYQAQPFFDSVSELREFEEARCNRIIAGGEDETS